MKTEISTLYQDLNQLLSDICELLSEEIKNEKISLKNRNVANELIERSKKQLQNISRIADDSGSYMDMNKNPEYVDPDNKLKEETEEIYTDVETFADSESAFIEGQTVCPYESTPVQDLPFVTKCGYLDRKDKFLFIEHQKRIYAAISKPWMLIYSSEKDQKPNECLDLRTYQAKSSETNQKDSKKRDDKCFELISSRKAKPYQFTATTLKDMLQWVTEIERTNRNANATYQNDCIKQISGKQNECDDDNIYEKLTGDEFHQETKRPYHHGLRKNLKDKESKPVIIPTLPPRVGKNLYVINRPMPVVPAANNEERREIESDSKENSLADDSHSFSAEDSDNIYDMLITDAKPHNITSKTPEQMLENISTYEDDEDVEYDEIQTDTVYKERDVHKKTYIEHSKHENQNINNLKQVFMAKENYKPKPVNLVPPLNQTVENTDDNYSEEIYDFIQTDIEVHSNSHLKVTNAEEHLKIEEKVKPEISKAKPVVKPKVFVSGKEVRQNSKVSSLMQQFTKKSTI